MTVALSRALPAVLGAGPRRALRRAARERLLRQADRADGRHRARGRAATGGVLVSAPRTSRRADRATCTASRAASTSARRRRRSTAHVARAGRPRRALHHARPPVLAPGGHEHAGAPVPPGRGLQPRSSRSATARRCRELGEAAVRAMYARGRAGRHQPHARGRDRRDVRADRALDRETGADPRAYPVIASHAGYRFGGQKYNVVDGDDRAHRRPRRRDRADLRPAPDQRRAAAHGHARRWPSRSTCSAATSTRSAPDHVAHRLRPRRVHQARRSAASRPRRTCGALAEGLRAALPRGGGRILTENALRVLERRFA